jgi:hypothetical protein
LKDIAATILRCKAVRINMECIKLILGNCGSISTKGFARSILVSIKILNKVDELLVSLVDTDIFLGCGLVIAQSINGGNVNAEKH